MDGPREMLWGQVHLPSPVRSVLGWARRAHVSLCSAAQPLLQPPSPQPRAPRSWLIIFGWGRRPGGF